MATGKKELYRVYVDGVTSPLNVRAEAVEVTSGWTRFSLGGNLVAQIPTSRLLAWVVVNPNGTA